MRAEFYVIPSKGLEQAIGMHSIDRDQFLTLNDNPESYLVMAQDCIINPGEFRLLHD